MAKRKGARYIGNGAFWPGVPARDLQNGEWEAIDEDIRTILLNFKLYRIGKSKKSKSEKERGN